MEDEELYPRRRSKRAHEAILSATRELLREKGYFGLTLEAAAAKAGVGKQTIYRWWVSKAGLVMEALLLAVSELPPLPDTGSVEEDLFQILDGIFQQISSSGSGNALAGLIAEAQADPAFAAAFRTGFIELRRERVRRVLRRGIERGEVKRSVNMEVSVDTFFGPMLYRLLIQHGPLDQEFARDLVRQLMTGIGAGPGA